jgi:hypothetical protein
MLGPLLTMVSMEHIRKFLRDFIGKDTHLTAECTLIQDISSKLALEIGRTTQRTVVVLILTTHLTHMQYTIVIRTAKKYY